MKKLRSQKAETLVETLMAILVVVLVMLFLSTAVSTASKVNAKVRKTDVALTYKNAVKGSENGPSRVPSPGNCVPAERR